MPLYEWVHNEPAPDSTDDSKCIKVTSVMNSFDNYDKRPEKCDHCGYSEDAGWRKVIGSTKFILRGIGWYRDGYS